MGRDKGLVTLEGRPMVEHVFMAASHLEVEVFIATNRPKDYSFLDLRTVSDREPGRGSLEGLRTALAAARTGRVLVLACDMPLVHPDLLNAMSTHRTAADALVPRFDGRLQPFLAVYARNCIQAVEAALDDDELEMRGFLRQLSLEEMTEGEVRRHDPRGMSFLNINTQDDLARARRILAGIRS